MSDDVRDAGYDDWIDAVEAGAGYYLVCENGHGALPPRRICPECGSDECEQTPLPETGELESYTVVHVPTPAFSEDAPYVTGIARFGAVRVTAVLRGIPSDEVETGMPVSLTVETRTTTDDPLVVFRPR